MRLKISKYDIDKMMKNYFEKYDVTEYCKTEFRDCIIYFYELDDDTIKMAVITNKMGTSSNRNDSIHVLPLFLFNLDRKMVLYKDLEHIKRIIDTREFLNIRLGTPLYGVIDLCMCIIENAKQYGIMAGHTFEISPLGNKEYEYMICEPKPSDEIIYANPINILECSIHPLVDEEFRNIVDLDSTERLILLSDRDLFEHISKRRFGSNVHSDVCECKLVEEIRNNRDINKLISQVIKPIDRSDPKIKALENEQGEIQINSVEQLEQLINSISSAKS